MSEQRTHFSGEIKICHCKIRSQETKVKQKDIKFEI